MHFFGTECRKQENGRIPVPGIRPFSSYFIFPSSARTFVWKAYLISFHVSKSEPSASESQETHLAQFDTHLPCEASDTDGTFLHFVLQECIERRIAQELCTHVDLLDDLRQDNFVSMLHRALPADALQSCPYHASGRESDQRSYRGCLPIPVSFVRA